MVDDEDDESVSIEASVDGAVEDSAESGNGAAIILVDGSCGADGG